VARHVGTPSVAEASALLAAAPGEVLVAKRRSAHATCAIAATVPAVSRP
jgi:cobalamin biosynthesis protein CbiG